jgi:hypothetical protein
VKRLTTPVSVPVVSVSWGCRQRTTYLPEKNSVGADPPATWLPENFRGSVLSSRAETYVARSASLLPLATDTGTGVVRPP